MAEEVVEGAARIGIDLEKVRFGSDGLLPVVVQEHTTGQVLMLAYMNREALERTIHTGRTWFWSRSRQALWPKGETSGQVQWVRALSLDCDGDALLVQVSQAGGGACHTGAHSCFHAFAGDPADVGGAGEGASSPEQILPELYQVILARKADPSANSYTSYLFREGINKILKKVGEETTEVVIAAKDPEQGPFVYEVADLFYHVLVLLAQRGVAPEEVFSELARRRK